MNIGQTLSRKTEAISSKAVVEGCANSAQQLHSTLAHFNHERLLPAKPTLNWQNNLHRDWQCQQLERQFLEQLRTEVIALIPIFDSTETFIAWFDSLLLTGAGQNHPLFDYLAAEASVEQMCWFLTQEVAGEAGFEDLLAYTQVKLPVRAKLEIARNYWDEMGRGKQEVMHGQLLERMVRELNLQPDIDTTVWEALALNNTMVGLALTREFAFQSIGALGVIELTAPARAEKVSAGMRRLGFSQRIRAYFDLHAAIDILHARAWIKEVLTPLIDDDPQCAPFIAEGALMRLLCGQRCFDRYQQHFSFGHNTIAYAQ